jgi:hypothetical protein
MVQRDTQYRRTLREAVYGLCHVGDGVQEVRIMARDLASHGLYISLKYALCSIILDVP